METCIRGFSFMPENKVEVINLQYAEGGELSRAWKKSRRQRLKELEAKVWEEFVKEQDIVHSVCKDDPYLFLERLPEDCLKELMELELSRMKKEEEKVGEVPHEVEPPKSKQQEFNELQEPRETMVTFADDRSEDQCDVIHILEDEGDDEVTGAEQEVVNDSLESPCTVRERSQDDSDAEPVSPDGQTKEKSAENVQNMIETSIYRAKVKDLQSKVNLELLAIITTLEAQDLHKIELEDIPKLQKQCGEFCARYNRIYLYELKRQIHDITRHNNSALPFARHTFLRSQMTRAISLQQNLLQALQVFHKWFTQKTPFRECADCLKTFTQIVREGDALCPQELHNEELLQTCLNLDGVVEEYMQRVDNYLNNDNNCTSRTKKSNGKQVGKKKSFVQGLKNGIKQNSEADAKLSMYSLDTLRSKPSSSKGNQPGSVPKLPLHKTVSGINKHKHNKEVPQKKKTPRSRGPLMRAPGSQRKREKPRDPDNIHTMVEVVKMCPSSYISHEDSPRTTRVEWSPHAHSKPPTPRGIRKNIATPRRSPRSPNPPSPRKDTITQDELKLALDAVKISETSVSPIIKVQCEKREMIVQSGPDEKLNGEKMASERQSARETAPLHCEEGKEDRKSDKDLSTTATTCEVSRLLRRLCAGSSPSGKNDRASGAKNAQLLCVNGGSPRKPSTPQLLRILEETIQKKAPKPQYYPTPRVKDVERFRMTFNTSSNTSETLFQYRTKFIQHMLSSPMYANSVVGKPWEMIGSVSEQIIDEILLSCAKEMQLEDYTKELYKSEIQ